MGRFWPWVYGFQCGDFIKVGIASDVRARLKQAQLFNPHPIKIVFSERYEHARRMEIRMHQLLADRAIGREWFRATPAEVRAAAREAATFVKQWQRDQLEWQRISAERPQKRVRNVESG